jgi:tripartite-type tricarboxylate transporter receptor subunit TctC
MKLPRRQFLRLAAGVAALPTLSCLVSAQTYPTRTIHVIVFFPAGGAGDILARLMGQWLSERLGRPFVIENRAGASGNIGTESVVRAAPDGYTLLWATSPNAINATLYQNLNYNFSRDIAPIAATFRVPNVMVLNPSLPPATVPEFIAYAKAHPAQLNLASGGNGTPTHLTGELFKMMAGVDLVHVPYRGEAPALTDLLAGQVQVVFATMPGSVEYIRAGKLRALAVTTLTRSEVLPNIPTVSEFLPGFEASTWFGLAAPKSTPIAVVDRLNKETNAALADPKLIARVADLGGSATPGSPDDFGKLIAEEIDKWAKVIQAAHITPE